MTLPDRSDADAVDRWYREHHPAVYRLCLGFLADRAEAEDLAQDAMLHLLDRATQCDPDQGFDSWRNTVVLNLCRDRRRRVARRRASERRAVEPGQCGPLPRVDDAVERAEVREELERALGALPEREREAFVLRDLEGASTAEVAQVMGVSRSSVRSLTTLARRRLRNLLAPRLSGYGGPSRA